MTTRQAPIDEMKDLRDETEVDRIQAAYLLAVTYQAVVNTINRGRLREPLTMGRLRQYHCTRKGGPPPLTEKEQGRHAFTVWIGDDEAEHLRKGGYRVKDQREAKQARMCVRQQEAMQGLMKMMGGKVSLTCAGWTLDRREVSEL